MDNHNLSAPTCAQPLNPRGITHINARHTTRYTVVGNHLTQHRDLSLTAIGLACHIQSLPSGTRVDIKTLAARFPEGETRIAAALRELEAHGYLARTRQRLPSGRIVTHTVSYNQPVAAAEPKPPTTPRQPRQATSPSQPTAPAPEPEPEREEAEPAPTPKAPLPEPWTPDLESHRTATILLATLHHHDRRLVLSERDVRRLAPAVAAWLERGLSPDAVHHALVSNLPPRPRYPANLIAYRLTEFLPPQAPPPAPPVDETALPRLRLHSCEGCEHAIRTPAPGAYCHDCREAGAGTATAA
ncbi:helix-turn-helix domain-containing protein [Streptomyces monashensis]|uniref:DNA-binding protein n=1 Tax=Streptomyces monashensis TaxID=1678012 RepID=A0A1S2PMW3_9ACTN|nr:helix-turn-helix domain-containing protein [Streptomyces monashensis]OIJ95148.1 DNA-binding protein [Streptomyces monashensis]